MGMSAFFQWVRSGFQRDPKISDDVVRGFLRVLENAREEDMPCSKVFTQLDEYVEKEVRGEDAARVMPLLKEHFDICSDCCDEYEALLGVLEKNSLK